MAIKVNLGLKVTPDYSSRLVVLVGCCLPITFLRPYLMYARQQTPALADHVGCRYRHARVQILGAAREKSDLAGSSVTRVG